MNKLSLTNIILDEGVYIELENPLQKDSRIVSKRSSLNVIPGEQLAYAPSTRETGNYSVIYSLVAGNVSNRKHVKPVMDVIKNHYGNVAVEVETIIEADIGKIKDLFETDKNGYRGPDLIFYLDSNESSSQRIAEFISTKFPRAQTHRLSKVRYYNFYQAFNWDYYTQATEANKEKILKSIKSKNFKSKTFTESIEEFTEEIGQIFGSSSKVKINGTDFNTLGEVEEYLDEGILELPIIVKYQPYIFLSKSIAGRHMSKNVHGKYDSKRDRVTYNSLEDFLNNTPSQHVPYNPDSLFIGDVYDRRILLVDDNIYTGTDMRLIFNDLDEINERNKALLKQKLRKELEEAIEHSKTVDKAGRILKYSRFVHEFTEGIESFKIELLKAIGVSEEDFQNMNFFTISYSLEQAPGNYKNLIKNLTDELRMLENSILALGGYALYRIESEDLKT